MALKLEEKKVVVAEVNAVAAKALSVVGAENRGLTVTQMTEPGAAARIVKAFAKDNEKLVTTLVSLGGQMLKPQDIDRVASLPTRAQAISQLLGVLKAPISKFVGTLAAPNSKLVRPLAAVLDAKKGAAAPAAN